MKITSISDYLEQSIENGTITEDSTVFIVNRKNNIDWVGRAGYVPVYTSTMEYDRTEIVGHENRVYEREYVGTKPSVDRRRVLTLRAVMTKAHQIAKTLEGDYTARMSYAIRKAWESLKQT